MPNQINKQAYLQLIEGDLEFLEEARKAHQTLDPSSQFGSCEYDHIRQILNWSVEQLYPPDLPSGD